MQEAIAYNQILAGATKQAAEAQANLGTVLAPAARGKAIDSATVNATYEAGMKTIRKAIEDAQGATGPQTSSATAVKKAIIRYLEGSERRYKTGYPTLIAIALNPSLTFEEKRAKSSPIFDRMEQEENEESAAAMQAQNTFAAEFNITLRRPK